MEQHILNLNSERIAFFPSSVIATYKKDSKDYRLRMQISIHTAKRLSAIFGKDCRFGKDLEFYSNGVWNTLELNAEHEQQTRFDVRMKVRPRRQKRNKRMADAQAAAEKMEKEDK